MLKRLALLICLLAPVPAFAMPQALVAIGLFFGASAATALAVGLFVVQLGLSVGMAVYGSAQQRRKERAARNEYNSKLQDRTITRVATDSPHVYVYGRAKVGSAIVAVFTSGDKDQFKHLVCVHAAHECDAIEEVYIAGKPLGALDAFGNVTTGDYLIYTRASEGQNTTGSSIVLPQRYEPDSVRAFIVEGEGENTTFTPISFSISGNTVSFSNPNHQLISVDYLYLSGFPRVMVRKHLGAPNDPADESLLAALPDKWSANSVLRGFTYTVIRLDLNQAEFQGGIPSIEVLLRGKKLYDPRTGTTAWSQNAALAIYDYLRSEMCGVPSSDIPLPQVITAANVCDSPWGGPRYTIDGSVTSDESQSAVLEKMAQAMAGGIVSTTWEMFAGAYVSPVMALDQSDIVGGIAITPGASDADIYNGVRGQYVGSDRQYVATDYTPYQNLAYVAADGRELWTNIDFPFTSNQARLYNLAKIFTEDQRNGYTVKATFSLKAWSLRIGDRVWLNSALFGWSSKVFRVTDKSYSPTSMIELTLKEDAAEIWDAADATVVDATPNTDLPNPYYVAPLESLTCESGTNALLTLKDGTIVSRIRVSWPQATTQAIFSNGEIQVEWSRIGSNIWEKIAASGDSTSTFITPVEDSAYYKVRARAFNPYMNTKSDWCYATPHKVIGKTEPPTNVTNFLYARQPDGTRQFMWSWDTDKPLDLAGYRIKYKQAASATWDEMTLLHNDSGFLVSSPYETNQLLAGFYTFAIKTVDTSGNEALNAVYITAQLDNPRLGKILVAESAFALGWPGVKTDGEVIDGNLEAVDQATWATLPSTWDAWTKWKANPKTSVTYDHPLIDLGAIITFKPIIQADSDGVTTLTESHSTDNTTYTPYAALAGTITARYLKVRAVTAGAYPLSRELLIWLEANTKTEDVNDLNSASAPVRFGVGDFRLPVRNTYSVIAQVTLALQGVGAGWSWVIVDKDPAGPRIRLYNANNVLADAVIDAYIKGY